MSTIEISPGAGFEYENFVNEIFDKIDENTKELMIKNVIMSHVEKKDEDIFEISEMAQSLTNRVKTLPDVDSVAAMLYFLAYLYPFWITQRSYERNT